MMAGSVLRGTSIVGGLTLLSRLLGFVRDVLVARLFGSGPFADAFFVAFRIPNLLRSIFAEGALTSAFVPVLAGEMKTGMSAAQSAFRSVLSLLLVVTIFLSLAGTYFAPAIVHLFAPGFTANSSKFELCVLLTRIMLPYIAFVSVIALLNGALNSVKIFGASALAQVVMNIVLILGACAAAYFESRSAVVILSVSVIAGGLAQVLAQVPALRRSGFSLLPSLSLLTPATRTMLRLMIPAVLGATVYQLSIFFNTLMASLLREGSVSWLFYADRLTQLPIGIFSIALASVLLPALSHAHAQADRKDFDSNLSNALRYSSFLMIPVCIGLGVLALPLVTLLFLGGQFDLNAAVNTAAAVQAYSLGLWAVSCHSMIVRAFVAQKDTLTSTIVGVLSLFLTVAFSVILVGPLTVQAGTMGKVVGALQTTLLSLTPGLALGHVGLALASSLSSIIAFLVIAYMLSRGRSDFGWGGFGRATLHAAVAGSAMGFVLHELVQQLSHQPAWVVVGLAIPIGIVVYGVMGLLLKNTELQETFALIRRIIARRRGTAA